MMSMPIQVVFEHIEQSDFIEARVRDEIKKLERYYDRIVSVRAVVSRPRHRRQKGDTYSVRLHLTVPGAPEIVVSRDPAATGRHEDMQVTIRDAFDAARRQLQDFARERQGQVKIHETPPHGVIQSLVPEGDHGFIAASDGREIYFHRNCVADGMFNSLTVGQEVRFSEAIGEKGPQATIVKPVGKHHIN
jgi:ribosomal subunit interface protein